MIEKIKVAYKIKKNDKFVVTIDNYYCTNPYNKRLLQKLIKNINTFSACNVNKNETK